MARRTRMDGVEKDSYKDIPIYKGIPESPEPESAVREYGLETAKLLWALIKRGGHTIKTVLQRAVIRVPKGVYNGVDTRDLNRRMRKINWSKDYYSPEAIARSQNNPRLQRDIMRVNRIFRDLKKLSDSDHHMGEELRWKLQRKHWMGTRMEVQTGNTLDVVQKPMVIPLRGIRTAPAGRRSEQQGQTVSTGVGNHQSAHQRESRRRHIAFRGGQMNAATQNTLQRHRRGLHL